MSHTWGKTDRYAKSHETMSNMHTDSHEFEGDGGGLRDHMIVTHDIQASELPQAGFDQGSWIALARIHGALHSINVGDRVTYHGSMKEYHPYTFTVEKVFVHQGIAGLQLGGPWMDMWIQRCRVTSVKKVEDANK